MALTANRDLNRYVDQELRTFSVAASMRIYKGALVGMDRVTGFVRNLVSGDLFAGVAYEEIDNSSGGSGGEQSIRLYTRGDFLMPVVGSGAALTGSLVFALDNDQATVTPAAGGSQCGTLIQSTSANQGIVRIHPMATPLVELAVHAPLASSTSAATTNPVMITQRAIRVVSAQVSFNTAPNSGSLDVGTDNANPNQLVAAFNLATLTAHVPASLTIAGRDYAKNARIWAKVGQASSSAGVGGLLSLRYFELP